MAVRRENVQVEVGEFVIPPVLRGRVTMLRKAMWHFDAPRDPLWGAPLESGPGPHVWGGDQA